MLNYLLLSLRGGNVAHIDVVMRPCTLIKCGIKTTAETAAGPAIQQAARSAYTSRAQLLTLGHE